MSLGGIQAFARSQKSNSNVEPLNLISGLTFFVNNTSAENEKGRYEGSDGKSNLLITQTDT